MIEIEEIIEIIAIIVITETIKVVVATETKAVTKLHTTIGLGRVDRAEMSGATMSVQIGRIETIVGIGAMAISEIAEITEMIAVVMESVLDLAADLAVTNVLAL